MQKEALLVDALWTKACEYLKAQVHESTYEQWFEGIVPVALADQEIVLGVSDDFFADWLEDNFSDILSEAILQAGAPGYAITFEPGHIKKVETTRKAKVPEASPKKAKPEPQQKEISAGLCSSYLSRHTFDNFVVGEENRYAFAVAQTAAQNPGFYNPLYIYGTTGTGKTHLLQAVANHMLKDNPRTQVVYMTCEEFLNNYVDSLRNKRHSEFRNSVRRADVLLIDDVHMLASKTQLQEEFFNTFNALYHENKQIILTSDKQPCEIKGLEDRLISRFESGVTSEISAPGFETRLAILRMMQEEHIIKLDDEVIEFVASRISSSVRRLKGALMRLVAYSSAMSNRRISSEVAEQLLHRLLEEETASKVISIETIQKTVAEHFDIRVNDILSSKRPKNIAEPRMVAMYLSRELTDHSYPEIGQAFGKNHATVMNAMKKVPEICQKNENMRRSVSLLQRQLST